MSLRKLLLLFLVLTIYGTCFQSWAQAETPGERDPSFSGDGVAQTILVDGETFNTWDSIIDSEDNIVVVGTLENPRKAIIARFTEDGNLDTTFSNDSTPGYYVESVTSKYQKVIQRGSDGKYIVGGTEGVKGTVTRFNVNGTLNAAFANNGVWRTSGTPEVENVGAVLSRPSDNKILFIAGYEIEFDTDNPYISSKITRLNADGSVDNTFGTITLNKGTAQYTRPLSAVLDSGKIIIAHYNYGSRTTSGILQSPRPAIVKLLQNGTVDTTFGTSGWITPPNGPLPYEHSAQPDYHPYFEKPLGLVIKLKADDKLLLGGSRDAPGNDSSDIVLMQRNPDGSIDGSFANNGIKTYDLNNNQRDGLIDFEILNSGNILILSHYYPNPGEVPSSPGFGMYFSLLFEDGNLDPSFSGDGKAYDKIAENAGQWASGINLTDTGESITTTHYLEEINLIKHYIETDETIAHRFRPLLYFDSEEKWRPLDIPNFFGEGFNRPSKAHEWCKDNYPAAPECVSITTCAVGITPCTSDKIWTYLRQEPFGWDYDTNKTYIDIHGTNDGGDNSEDLGSVRSPDPDCWVGILQDCASGESNRTYYNTIYSSGNSMVYNNYWTFYRYNEFDPGFDHEGDWEHTTVASYSGDPQNFEWVAYSAHTNNWRYLRGVISCDGDWTPGTCGTENNKIGQRPNIFVARGSHANYPQPCTGSCWQTDNDATGESFFFPEKNFDGSAEWLDNYNPDTLENIPVKTNWLAPYTEENWTNLPEGNSSIGKGGLWGYSFGDEAGSTSPGNQATFEDFTNVECTERYTDDQTVECSSMPLRSSSDSSSFCKNWAGPFIQVATCSGNIRTKINTKVTTNTSQATDSEGGVAQSLGPKLQSGDKIRITGNQLNNLNKIIYKEKGQKQLQIIDFNAPKLQKTQIRNNILVKKSNKILVLIK